MSATDSMMNVTLSEDILVCEALGAFSLLFKAGESLPATQLVRATYSVLPGANNSVSFFAGKRPLAAALYKPVQPDCASSDSVVEINVRLNEAGCFSTEAVAVCSATPFVTFCATIDTPLISAGMAIAPQPTMHFENCALADLMERANAKAFLAGPLNAPNLLEAGSFARQTERTLPVYIGYVNDDEVEILLVPGSPLPTSASVELRKASAHREIEKLRFKQAEQRVRGRNLKYAYDDVLAEVERIKREPHQSDGGCVRLLPVHRRDLDAVEMAMVRDSGRFKLIDDDLEAILTFTVPDNTVELDVRVDASGKLSLWAIDHEGDEKEAVHEGESEALDMSALAQGSDEGDDMEPSETVSGEDVYAADEPFEWTDEDFPMGDTSSDEEEGDREAEEVVLDELEDVLSSGSVGEESRLFISHRSESDADFALWLVERLEQRGIRCWIAPRDIKAGANWNRAIMAAVKECSAMVVVISESAVESEFVQAEVHKACTLRKQVVPLLLQPDLPYTDIDARLETKQRIDWYKIGMPGLGLLEAVLDEGK
jgi:hypothetical protein